MGNTAYETPNMSLADSVVIVTGASRGIGRGVAEILAKTGATVAVTARHMEDAKKVAREIQDAGARAVGYALDVRDVQSIDSLFRRIEADLGRVDVLVNNAGVGNNHDAVDVTESDWDEIMDVNLKGLFFCCQAAGRLMLNRGYGRIVNISSQAGLVGIERHAVYSASKGGVNLLTKVLALEWGSRGVTVNAIAPTFIYTPGTADRLDQPEFRQSVLSRIPVGRVGTEQDVAAAIIYLASPAASLVTGTIIPIDGGWTAQ